ncbi:MAG: cytochrome c [Nitrospirota bacterium]|jgi:cytochrome c556
MKIRFLAALVVVVSLAAGSADTVAAEGHGTDQGVMLSPELLDLLRAEMREVTAGVQELALSLVTADWKALQETSAKIRASYIMEKKLTPTQAGELEKALPGRFKQLDAEFHQRAAKLGAAAAAHDPELVVFHYSRLVESCVRCHSSFARNRFPGFASPVPQDHHH